MTRLLSVVLCAALAAVLVRPVTAQSALHLPLDRVLDTYVRDGMVYYRALRSDRGGLDRYVGSLDVPAATVNGWSRAEQMAFWVNAYNGLVLRTVVNAYPIQGRAPEYPANSIRQVPGAFAGVRHPVGGRVISLDEIESDVLAGFGDARVFLLLGRGAIGTPRLRSEAISAARIEAQMNDAVAECARRVTCLAIDEARGTITVTPIVSWRQNEFIATFAMGPPPAGGPELQGRSPVERAVVTMVYPHLFDGEQQYIDKNSFQMTFGEIDWRLNDLTGR